MTAQGLTLMQRFHAPGDRGGYIFRLYGVAAVPSRAKRKAQSEDGVLRMK